MYHIYSERHLRVSHARSGFLHLISVFLILSLVLLSTPSALLAQEASPSTEIGEGTQGIGSTTENTPEIASGTDAIIETGNATSTGDVSTSINFNDTNTGSSSGDIAITTDNTGIASTTMDVSAQTGINIASTSGSATITTGNSVASANVINVVNTNIVNSSGLMFFLNLLFGNTAVDLRNLFSFFGSDTSPSGNCSLTQCDDNGTSLNIQNNNDATIQNDITVRSGTGGNSATAGDGKALVVSGDAAAAANVVNVANTNIVNSSYLLISVNNFGSLADDIILPAASFFNKIFGTSIGAGAHVSVTNDNTADIQNNIDTTADTGGNDVASGDGSSTITTGNGTTAVNVVNEANQNVVGDSIYILVRIHGTWTGKIFGLPEGITWQETSDGIELYGTPGALAENNLPVVGTGDNVAIENNNHASVFNNISVMALTGDNYASSDGGDAEVNTGDAYAAANVVNIVNTNVVGQNWILAIFNIFGDWSGNISFGQPDLWLGARAENAGGLHGGSCLDYYVTLRNNGDADASQIALDASFDPTLQSLKDESDTATSHFLVGTLKAGEMRDVHIPGCLTDSVGYNSSVVTRFAASLNETDHNPDDNTDEITLTTAGVGGGGRALRLGDSDLTITKSVSRDEVIAAASSTVSYTISVKNVGDPVYNARLVDTIYDPSHKAIHQQLWDLDTIKDETITVNYDVAFNASNTPGIYTNEAFIEGYEHSSDIAHNYGSPYRSKVAKASLKVVTSPDATTATCDRYLTDYIRKGANNNPVMVAKLQKFLRENEHMSGITLSGNYDDATYEAVRTFQEKYANDVLAPWGIPAPTGYVYYTTARKINELYCKGASVFGYTEEQQHEIDTFRTSIKVRREHGEIIPSEELQTIGRGDDGRAFAAAIPRAESKPNDTPEIAETTDATAQTAAAVQAVAAEARTGIFTRIKAMIANAFSRF